VINKLTKISTLTWICWRKKRNASNANALNAGEFKLPHALQFPNVCEVISYDESYYIINSSYPKEEDADACKSFFSCRRKPGFLKDAGLAPGAAVIRRFPTPGKFADGDLRFALFPAYNFTVK
jgi:hypothetical protein